MSKQIRSLMIVLCLLVFCASSHAINPYLQGDVNDDDVVSIQDLTELIDVLLQDNAAGYDGYCDVDGDGIVNIYDLTQLIDILLGNEPENENIVEVSLPAGAPITVDDVVVIGYGSEIAQSRATHHLLNAGKRYYVTDANTISVHTRDGKLVYDSYVSLDVNNHERTVTVDALETAYTMLIPLFSYVCDATPDNVLNALKNMLADLDETQALATAIDNSIVGRGYFEISDVETEYRAAVEKVIDKLGLRENFLSGEVPGGITYGAPSEPSVLNGEYGHWGLKLVLNDSEWIADAGGAGGGGGSSIAGQGRTVDSYGGAWKCNLTAYNNNRFAYTAWTRGYIDDNGQVKLYSDDLAINMQYILKPQRLSTFMNIFLDPVSDPFSKKSWEKLRNYYSETWKVLIDPEYDIKDMTWDNTKVKMDLSFTTPQDVVCVCGPNQDFVLYYNIIKLVLEPIVKKICKNLGKAAKGETASEPDFFTIFTWQLVKDLDYSYQFKVIWESSTLSNGEKLKRIAELTWPKLVTSLDDYVRQNIDLWIKDRCMEVFGYKAISDFEAAVEKVNKNITKYYKVVEMVADPLLGIAGIVFEGSAYYNMDLDFGDKSVNTKEFTVGGVTFTMVEVDGGTFQMGASMKQLGDAHDDEYPLHNVTLSDYYIGQTEVTQELWEAVMGSVPGSSYKNAKYPVGGVSWLECQQFIAKLNEMTGEKFRLPTEAEWEYAARGGGGTKDRLYAGSDNPDHVAWYNHNSSSRPHNVGTKLPNPLLIYDMSGNAMEWCSDWYGPYGSDAQVNPTGPAAGTMRVCRGGGWSYGSDLCRVSCRNSFAPSNSMNGNLGLRLVWEPKTDDETFTVNGVTFKMIAVEGGTFMMGATEDDTEANSDERPAHQVTLSSYCIGETEVTQALWVAVMGSNPSYFQGDLNRPVEYIKWDDIQLFIQKLSELTGRAFRLPTEAEWEYAARGGNKSHGYKYAGGNVLNDVAWWGNNNGGNSDYCTHPVGTKLPNELGIYDMTGNVWEWCQDWFGNYQGEPQNNPEGPLTGPYRVVRGACWNNNSKYCRVTMRYQGPCPGLHGDGMRLAL